MSEPGPAGAASIAGVQVFVLAGGFGTRLRPVVSDRPKVLAPVGGRPFLDVLVEQLHGQGVRRLALLLGHLHDQVEAHVAEVLAPRWPDLTVTCSVEPAPLGTAGALRHAAALATAPSLLLNGDTYVELEPRALLAAHRRHGATLTIAAQHVADAGRYGTLELDDADRVHAFREKDPARGGHPGWINAGAYVVEPDTIASIPAGRAVSLEAETIPGLLAAGADVRALRLHGTFIDFGSPASYAQLEAHLTATRPPP
ncbi:MAG TPA: nucleotidyltransferase family protein [Kofleriaceae bacterium]|nr:nucleotidyltransferase family protein [Kofleriaceae bacterium]